jgi:hypothetical protein
MRQALAESVLHPHAPSSSSMHGGLLPGNTLLVTLQSDAFEIRKQSKRSEMFDPCGLPLR